MYVQAAETTKPAKTKQVCVKKKCKQVKVHKKHTSKKVTK
jgi:azurin